MSEAKNILICPLEWGLGHAGRMIPLARELRALNHNIFFGSGKELLAFAEKELPGVSGIEFPGFRIKYSRILPQYLIILLRSPILIFHIFREHKKLKEIIKEYSIDIVISDSRIGLWNKGVKSVFITHQLRIPFPRPFRFLEITGVLVNRLILKKYTFCFVPDLPGELNVAGKLSHRMRLPGNVRYIGILSRFNGNNIAEGSQSSEKCLVILSGPEPQRSLLKQKLTDALHSSGKPAVFLEGKPGIKEKSHTEGNILYHPHLNEEETLELFKTCDTIITRSGYTTIMELIGLGKSALLIPTPGQTEQEYLAEYLSQKGWFVTIKQKELNNNHKVVPTEAILPSGIMEESNLLLSIALTELLEE